MADTKWCGHCRKNDHDDAECRCTRLVRWDTPRPSLTVTQAVARLYPRPHRASSILLADSTRQAFGASAGYRAPSKGSR